MKLSDLERAFGTNDKDIANAIGVSRQLVSFWRRQGKISLARQSYIELKTGGRFRADVQDRQKARA